VIRKLVKDSVIYTTATVLTKGVQLFLLPVLSRLLSPEEYGINELVFIYTLFAVSLLTVEINQAIARFYPPEKLHANKVVISSTGLMFVLFNFLVFLGLAVLFSTSISSVLLRSPAYARLIRIAAVALVFNGLFSYLQAQLRWDLRSFDYSLSSLVFVIVSTIATIASIALFDLGGAGVFVGQIAGALCAGALSFFRNRNSYRMVFSRKQLGIMLRFSGPLLVSTWLVLISLYSDRFFIRARLDISSVGIYSMASKFSSVVSLLFVGFNMAFSPLVFANAESKELPAEISRLFSIFLPLAGLLSCFTFIFAREIIYVLTASAYYSGRRVMPMLVLSTILSNMYLFTPGLSIRKDTKPIILISFISMVSSIAFNVFLVPRFGMAGSALARVLTTALVFFLYFRFSQNCYYIPFSIKSMVVMGALVLVSAFSALALDFSSFSVMKGFVIKTIIMALISVFVYTINPSLRAAVRRIGQYIKTSSVRQ